jgi:hypothetical protein
MRSKLPAFINKFINLKLVWIVSAEAALRGNLRSLLPREMATQIRYPRQRRLTTSVVALLLEQIMDKA